MNAYCRHCARFTSFVLLTVFLLVPTVHADSLKEEAQRVLELQKEYWKERIESQWEAVYARQHPKLKEVVTLEFFINRRGLVGVDSPEVTKRPNMGVFVMVPPSSGIVEKSTDPLGFPIKPRYRIIASPWIAIDGVHHDKVWISREGRFARVDLTLDATETLPPHLFRWDKKIPHKRRHTDYFEKVGGEWKVALMEHKPNISGGKMGLVFIPNQLEDFESMEWQAFDASELAGGADSHE